MCMAVVVVAFLFVVRVWRAATTGVASSSLAAKAAEAEQSDRRNADVPAVLNVCAMSSRQLKA